MKITLEVMTVDKDGKKKERSIKYMAVLLTDGGEATSPEKINLYVHAYINGLRNKMMTYFFRLEGT